MARRRTSGMDVDMFPFLSVLCSVIGVLMLFMMITISTRVIEADESIPVVKPEEDGEEDGVEDGIDADEYRRLDQQITQKEALLQQRIEERNQLQRKLALLRARLSEKKRLLAQARQKPHKPLLLNKRDKVRMLPHNPAAVGKKPIFIEVTIDGYIRQPDKTLYPPIEREGDITDFDSVRVSASPELADFLKRMENKPDEFLVFLIHPNGVAAFDNMEIYIYKHHSRTEQQRIPLGGDRVAILERRIPKISYGKEPFSSDWEFVRGK